MKVDVLKYGRIFLEIPYIKPCTRESGTAESTKPLTSAEDRPAGALAYQPTWHICHGANGSQECRKIRLNRRSAVRPRKHNDRNALIPAPVRTIMRFDVRKRLSTSSMVLYPTSFSRFLNLTRRGQ